jgi:hypothetical protein
MKKHLLILIIFISCFYSFGQDKFDNFVGMWKPTGTNKVNVLFYKDKNGGIKTNQYDTRDGETLEILSIKKENEEIVVETLCRSNDWYSSSVYSLEVHTGMLKCITNNSIGSFESYYEIDK